MTETKNGTGGRHEQVLPAPKTLINRKKLHSMIPLSERTIFNMEQRSDFPRRIVLTSRNVAWDLEEVLAWIQARKLADDHAARPGDITPMADAA